jgi:hypothetical protein
MATPFLQHVATHIHNHYENDMGDMAVVFPGRRAAVFFRKYLASINHKNIWMPRLMTVADFFREQSGLLIADELKLLFELYKIFIKETKSKETFDQFYYWGGMLLSDFDDVDKYLTDARQLYSNVKELNEIDQKFGSLQPDEIEIIRQFWTHFNPEAHSYHKQEFVRIWSVLYNIYVQFREILQAEGIGYEGMVFRKVAEAAQQKGHMDLPWSRVFFVGLNVLTPSEKQVMKALQRAGKASFFWDYDDAYMNDWHESGHFMRDNIMEFPQPAFNNPTNHFATLAKKIKVLAVASNVGQAKALSQALDGIAVGEKLGHSTIETCIVLGDENLLLPVLYSIPKEIGKVNVTMGYPMGMATVFHFIKLLMEMQQASKKGPVFFHQQALAVLNHPYLSFWEGKAQGLKEEITRGNIVYIAAHRLHAHDVFKLIFMEMPGPGHAHNYFTDILYAILNAMENQVSRAQPDQGNHEEKGPKGKEMPMQPYFELEKEFLLQAYLTIKKFGEMLAEMKLEVELPTYFKMLRKVLQAAKVQFIGEPLAGLQVMGTLETRALDFKNLVITSMNEGAFPKKTTALSFIPYNLRRAFNMPTYRHQDAIYAYYFYRLLQRAENICLIYNSNNDGALGGEMSRFIYQLKYTTGLPITFENVEFPITGKGIKEISVKSNAAIREKLEKFVTGKGSSVLSPSAINVFKNCSLRFYFRYVLGLKETEEVQEEVDQALFGDILHLAIKNMYQPFLGKEMDKIELGNLLADKNGLDKAIDAAFAQAYWNKESDAKVTYTGQNVIIKEVIRKYVRKIIEEDQKSAPFELVALEAPHHTTWPLFDGKMDVNIGGTIDRVDLKNGQYRIIDYKTGIKHNKFKTVENLFFS